MNEIKRRAGLGERRLTLVVPEQYSHDAERQLLRVVGDSLSLHGEVLSFKRLAARVAEDAGEDKPVLDSGAALLMMYRAVGELSERLEAYGGAERRAHFAEALLQTVTELKNGGVNPEELQSAALPAGGALGKKLRDLALIMSAYDAMTERSGAVDSGGLLYRLAETIEKSPYCASPLYFDGFNDFTEPESRVISALIRAGADLTFCLTMPNITGDGSAFRAVRDTANGIIRLAREYGAEYEIISPPRDDGAARRLSPLLAEYAVFGDDGDNSDLGDDSDVGGDMPFDASGIELFAAPDAVTECEYAAAIAESLVRSGYRWGDIAVMSRGEGGYPELCESIFERRGIPVFRGGRDGILEKPPIRLIVKALEIVASGWDYEDVFAYLKTGFAGVPMDCVDVLESIAIRRDIRGRIAWTRESAWETRWRSRRDADIGSPPREMSERELRLDAARMAASKPLAALDAALSRSENGAASLRALYEFLEEIQLPAALSRRAAELDAAGHKRLSAEYAQLWDVIVGALDRMHAALESTYVTPTELARLFSLLASRLDVGVIPVSLDRVTVGDMAMNRRRDIRALIVVGATDAAMPSLPGKTGILSDAERDELIENYGVPLRDDSERLLYRELNVLYSALTLPSERLIVIYPEGSGARASFVVERLRSALGLAPRRLSISECRPASEINALRLARERADTRRSLLSHDAAARLYGVPVRLSATRVERLFSCRFAFFMQNGLRARPRESERFDAAQAGTFTHFVLERAAAAALERGGFGSISDDEARELTRRFAREYIDSSYPEDSDGTARLRYLLRRLAADTERVTLDLKAELERSDFEPLKFELEFRAAAADGALEIMGVTDRVDGWRRGGELYIRVTDYKTGKKEFSLSDIYHGINMQLPIYVLALGETSFGGATPAGMLYTPARDEIFTADKNVSDEIIAAGLAKTRRRSGLIINDAELMDAMERGGEKLYLPVKEQSLVTHGQLERLLGYVGDKLSGAARELRAGDISAQPYFKTDADNACIYCKYKAACLFGAFPGDKKRVLRGISGADFWEKIGAGEMPDMGGAEL
jgi:ATP-dependent helicase/nuclease subunit B